MLHLARQTRSAVDRAQSLLSFMSHPASFTLARDPLPDHEQKQAALELSQRGLGGSAPRRRRRRLPGAGQPVRGARRTGRAPTARTRWRNSSKAFPRACATASFRCRWRSSKLASCDAVIAREAAIQYADAISIYRDVWIPVAGRRAMHRNAATPSASPETAPARRSTASPVRPATSRACRARKCRPASR